MLQATVLGSGASPGQLLALRRKPKEATLLGPSLRRQTSPPSCGQHIAHPRSLLSSSTNDTSSIPSSSKSTLDDAWTPTSDEVLTWSGSEVTWSRGVEVVRRFTFAHEQQEVTCATFAWIYPNHYGNDVPRDSPESLSATGITSASGNRAADAKTFGPFDKSQFQMFNHPQTSAVSQPKRVLMRTVVVFLESRAHIFFATGEDVITPVPFAVGACWALPTGGLMVQRALDPRDVRRTADRFGIGGGRGPRPSLRRASLYDLTVSSVLDEDVFEGTEESGLPRLYTLTETFGEFKVVHEAHVNGGIIGDLPTLVAGHPLEAIQATETVMLVSPDPYPFVVTWNDSEGKIIFYRRAVVPLEREETQEPATAPHNMGPEELMNDTGPILPPRTRAAGRASLGRGAVSTDRRLSSGADPLDRARRRVSRMSAANELPELDDEFAIDNGEPSAVFPTQEPAPPRPRNLSGSHEAKQRRVSAATASIMREDMQRPRRGGLDVVAKDLRETTMMMGLTQDDDSKRSEVVLDRIWDWSPPGSIDPATVKTFISDNRSTDNVFINVLIKVQSYPPTLFTFQVDVFHAPTPHYIVKELRASLCTTAAAVVATRPGIFDTLVLVDGQLQLISASGHQIPVAIPEQVIDGRDEVAHKLELSLSMVLDRESIAADMERRIVDLVEPSGSRVTAVYSDGERVRVSLDFALPDGLARRALEALSYALLPEEYTELSEAYLVSLQKCPASELLETEVQWRVLADVLCSKCGVSSSTADSRADMLSSWENRSDPVLRRLARRLHNQKSIATPTSVQPSPGTARVLLALHLVAQDCRLSSITETELSLVAPVILRLSAAVGRAEWIDYWRRLMPASIATTTLPSPASNVETSILDQFHEPPDVLAYLTYQITRATKPFPSPQTCFGRPSVLASSRSCLQTALLSRLYACMAPASDHKGKISTERRALKVVQCMVDNGLGPAWIANLPFGVGLPIREMVRVCQLNPPANVSADIYTFIGRQDLAAISLGQRSKDLPMGAETSEVAPTIGDLVNGVSHIHSHFSALPHVRFGLDKRLDEVERIMQTTRQRTIPIEEPKGLNELDVMQYFQNVVNTIANRTLSITVGKGMFEFGSRTLSSTDKWDIPLIELAVKVVPLNQVLKAQLIGDGAEWPCFHNGASAALSIAPDSQGVDISWIAFNRPATLSAEHGGFLLGLGLTGQLADLNARHAYSYLNERHDMTSIGLLLGIAASFAGSGDLTLTRMISLHTVALLPPGAMELQASPLVQSVALMSLGLLYVGSKNLRYAEKALEEIARPSMPGIDNFNEYREAYSFSAAMAFGLIMLGRGGDASSEVERRMLAALTPCIHGEAPQVGHKRARSNGIDATVNAPGATLALGLMFLRTNRKDIASILDCPTTLLGLESVRPDHLLIRTLARALIVWDEVRGTMEWIDAQLPPFMATYHNGHKSTNGMDLQTELAYLNIVAGACLGLGLRYASTSNEAVHSVIIHFFGLLGKLAAGQSMTYEGRIRRNTARASLNIVTLALAVLMAGSGELNIMRRLRMSHGQEGAGVSYGSHMAMHMALGLLFLGRGYFTLGNSNLAIASMAISFFPRFLSLSTDNRAYPQAYRHLWAMAVEPRCLIARDVDTRESIFLPIKVKVGGKASEQSLISPTLVPPFATITSIAVDSPRYWPVTYDLTSPLHKAALVRTRTIWVKRKAGFLDYAADPRGYRSMFVRAGTISGFDMHYDLVSPAAPLQLSAAEGIELISTHASDPVCIVLARTFAGDTPLENFLRAALFECISLDKPDMLPLYLSIGLAMQRARQGNDDLQLENAAHTALIQRFYRPAVFEREYASTTSSGERRQPQLRSTFLQTAARRLGGSSTSGSTAAYLSGDTSVADSDSTTATSLSTHLARNGFPPISLLDALRQLVASDGGATPHNVLELKVRTAADRYAAAVERQWDLREDGGEAVGARWHLDGLREAMEAWRV